MIQLIQNIRTGKLEVEEIPSPQLRLGGVLVRTACSLISAGTERTTVDVAKKSLFEKSRSRPDLVRRVVDRAKREGIWKTLELVRNRINTPIPLGYSCAGVVLEVAEDVEGLKVGNRVACAGAGYANHAEINFVPKNLVARIPDGISYEEAAFTTVSSIALQSLRLADVRLGERIAVVGLGLVGQITVQLLKVAGCRVLGIDIDPFMIKKALENRADIAINNSSDDVSAAVASFTNGYGVDATLITAATPSDEPIKMGGEITREKGRVIVVGDVGLRVPREPYYLKEIELKISRSYGPGRYDPSYEEGGIDYPFAYVRFTENRNMEAVLEMLALRQLNVLPLITHRFPIERASEAYDLVLGKNEERYIGILFQYVDQAPVRVEAVHLRKKAIPFADVQIGAIGAGNYASAHLFPHLKSNPKVVFRRICTAGGLSARTAGERFGFAEAVGTPDEVVTDEGTNLVMVVTRHDGHAPNVIRALKAGKHVFVEKPLCLNESELSEIDRTYAKVAVEKGLSLTVGFNRRFAPLTNQIKAYFDRLSGPKIVQIRVNAGPLSKDHWLNDPVQGGGRILGEGCHFIDLLLFLVNDPPSFVYAVGCGEDSVERAQDAAITVAFENGSVGAVMYNSMGDSRFPKERIEIYGGQSVGVIDDFRTGLIVADGRERKLKSGKKQDKGQIEMLKRLVEALTSDQNPIIPYEQLVMSTRTIFAVTRSLASGKPEMVESLQKVARNRME